MRGKHRSEPLERLVREAQGLEAQGAQEINLVAQDLGHYGRDLGPGGPKLPDLLEALLAETSVPWYRLLYVYSAGLSERLVELVARSPRIVPYLDIPIQHAADRMLERMRRPERQRTLRDKLGWLRGAIPDLAIRTTCLVGFPGETDDDFRELLAFLEEAQFDRLGAFSYSPQDGTRATQYADDVSDAVKRDRLEELLEVQRAISAERLARVVGREGRVLVDRVADPDGAGATHVGRGARLTDVDGRTYLDYVCSWGPLILGHAHPAVLDAIRAAAAAGWSYGAPCEAEVELAEQVQRRMPTVEMVRFVNSGTEATMAAVRVARAATRRNVLLKFAGCYHGHADSFLVKAGSGVATLGLPDSPGVPAALAELTVTVPFNDAGAVEDLFRRRGDELAAVIVEPYVGNAGFIAPEAGFHDTLRRPCDRHGALLIFDEVMTGFRVAAGGAQERLRVRPDLTTLGKIVGGGMPVGAYGGRADLMRLVAPEGPVYQAGTLAGNPVAMAAGLATLREAERPGVYETLERRTARLVAGIGNAARRHGVPVTTAHAGSMWGMYFAPGPVRNFAEAKAADASLFARWHRAALARGVFLAPSAFEAGFVSSAHTDADIDSTITQLDAALGEARARQRPRPRRRLWPAPTPAPHPRGG